MTRNATQTDLERTDSADILPDADRAPGAIGDGFDQEPPPSRRRLDSVLLAANLPSLMAVPLSLASTLGGIAELTSTGSNLDRDDIRKGLSFSAGAAFFDIDAETMVSTIGGVRVLPVYGWLDKRDSIVHRILGLASIGSARRSQGRLPTPAYPRSSWTSIRPAVISRDSARPRRRFGRLASGRRWSRLRMSSRSRGRIGSHRQRARLSHRKLHYSAQSAS